MFIGITATTKTENASLRPIAVKMGNLRFRMETECPAGNHPQLGL